MFPTSLTYRRRPDLPPPASAADYRLARDRLWLGISCVGTFVLLATVAIAWKPFHDLRAVLGRLAAGDLAADLATLGLFVAAYALIALPFDARGRRLVPREEEEGRSRGSSWRPVFIQAALYWGFAAILLGAGRSSGPVAAIVTFAAMQLALLGLQPRLIGWFAKKEIRVLGSLDGGAPFHSVESRDPGVTAAIIGLPGFARVLVPARWLARLSPTSRDLLLARLRSVLVSGDHTRGVVAAWAWNLAGFTLASLAPAAGFGDAPALIQTALGFTIWSFLGLLLLPGFSRRAVVAADRRILRVGNPVSNLSRALGELRALTHGVPTRSAREESIFHPVPAPAERLERASRDGPVTGCWHVARTALFLSWAGLSLLPRAVHCNCGRPELWALLPTE